MSRSLDGLLRFTHPLLASAIYQEAADGERRLAHRRLAPVVPDPVHRARHLALGAAGPDADLAATIEAAAKLGRERGLAIAAAELADYALRLTPLDGLDDRRRRAASAARAHDAAGDRAWPARLAAAELADALPEPHEPKRSSSHPEFETPAGALAMLEQGLAEASAAPRLQAVIHARLAENGYFGLRDRVPFVARHARASLRLAEQLDDDALRVSALSILAIDQFASGRRGALALAERAHRLAAARKDPRLEKDAAGRGARADVDRGIRSGACVARAAARRVGRS